MRTRRNSLINWVVTVVAASILVLSAAVSEANQDFVNWLNTFMPEAKRQGIAETTWNRAFAGITEPDDLVLERAAYQPEFVQEIWEYLDTRVNPLSVEKGTELALHNQEMLTALERKFGVSRAVLMAIWSMETNYGAVLERRERLHYVPQALATLGWGDDKRSKFARSQLIAVLQILQAGDVSRDNLLGSWAGAMGHTQFIPTSYLAYAVDVDGDGRRDIWNSVPDALGTAANLLAENGWRSGKPWGYEVVLPAGIGKYAEETKTLAEWQRLGVTRPAGKAFLQPGDNAILKVLAGENGPGFLMMKNFFVIKRYNNSDKYALAVCLLADWLAGGERLVQNWPRPADSLSYDEKMELQHLLKNRGYYDGEIDGQPGSATREAIREFEKQTGLQVNGMPTRSVLDALKK